MAIYVLIGGGDVGRGNTIYETKEIDEAVVKLAKKDNPNFLFIGLASSFSDSYYDTMKKIYTALGCTCQYLKKKNIINNPDIVKEKITKADIIYFCGGDTLKLITDLNTYNIVELLKEKIKTEVVLVGMSAGAICMAKSGFSDCKKVYDETANYEFINGLNFLDINICPHYENRKDELKAYLQNDKRQVYALENNTALVVANNEITYLKSKEKAAIYNCYYKDNNYIEEKLF